jgi:hypothetical protein
MASDGSLVPVIVGGLLTIGGGVVATIGLFVRDMFQARKDAEKKQREKFEELVGALFEFDHWVDNLRRIYFDGESIPEAVSPFAKLLAISTIYFPRFDNSVRGLSGATSSYRVWMTTAAQKRLNGDIGGGKRRLQ